MAGKGLGALTLDMIVKLGGWVAGLDKADRTLKQRTKSMNATAVAFGVTIGKFMTDAIVKLGQSIPAVIDRMDDISKAAKTVGMSTEGFSRLSFAAELANVSAEELQSGLGRLVKAQSAAMDVTSEQAKIFKALGIAVKEADGSMRPTRDVMLDFADIFSRLKGSPESMAAGFALIGKGFQTFVPLINEGSEAIRNAEQEADALGITLSGPAGEAAEEFNDNVERLKTATAAMAQQIAVNLLPEMVALTAAMVTFAKEGREGAGVAGFISSELASVSKAARATSFEIVELKKAWNEQGLFGEGILSVLDRANKKFLESEATALRLAGLANSGGPRSRGTARKGAAQGAIDFAANQAADRLRGVLSDPGGSAAKAAAAEAKRLAAEAKRLAAQQAQARAQFQDDIDRLAASMGGEYAKANTQYLMSLRDIKKEYDNGGASAEQYAKQQDLLKQQFDDAAAGIKASVEGPLSEAAYSYQKALKELRDDAEATGVSDDKVAASEARLRREFEETTKSIQERQDPLGTLLEDMQFELDLLGKTNAERLVANELRRIEHGMTDQEIADYEKKNQASIQAIKNTEQELEAQEKAISAMDDFRSSFEDFVVAAANGKASFKDFANEIIQQIIRIGAAKLTANLFGEQGTSNGGLFGAIFAAFAGSGSGGNGVLGSGSYSTAPGYAEGTQFHPGGMAWVGEHGPELVNLPRGSQVVPSEDSRRMGGITQVIHNNFASPEEPRTRDQVAAAQGFAAQRAIVRSGR